MANCCKEDMTANQRRTESDGHRFKTSYQQGLFTAESPLTSTLLLVICVHNISEYVRCTGTPHIHTDMDCTCASHPRDGSWAQKDLPGWWQSFRKCFFSSRVCPKHLLISSESILGDFLVCNAPDTPRWRSSSGRTGTRQSCSLRPRNGRVGP